MSATPRASAVTPIIIWRRMAFYSCIFVAYFLFVADCMPQRLFAKADHALWFQFRCGIRLVFNSAGLDLFRRLDFEPAWSHCRPCNSPHIRFEQHGGNIACSPLQTTSCSPASGPAPRWARCCAAIGSRSAAPASSTPIPIKPMRLLGEDLVLYRDRGGRYGLIDRHCAHRRADMAYGWVEEKGIRCSYHGWLVTRPAAVSNSPTKTQTNPKPSKAGCETKAYPVKECAGLLFAYLGPLPAPELPVWEPFTWANGFREIVLADMPCNWFQCQENSCDPVHFEWMHDNWGARLRGGDKQRRAQASETQVRGIRARLHLQARARRPERRQTAIGRSAASRCGRTVFISAAISNGACRSTTRTRSRSRGSSCACPRAASPMCRRACRCGKARSRRRRPLDHQPRHQSGHRRLGRPGPHRRPHQGEPALERRRHLDDARALLQGDGGDGGRQGAGRHHPQRQRGRLHLAAQHGARVQHRRLCARRSTTRIRSCASG